LSVPVALHVAPHQDTEKTVNVPYLLSPIFGG